MQVNKLYGATSNESEEGSSTFPGNATNIHVAKQERKRFTNLGRRLFEMGTNYAEEIGG